MTYVTLREEKISKLYIQKGINTIDDLSIERVSEVFNIIVQYHPFNSRIFFDDNCAMIFLNENHPIEIQRADFFHEMAHFLEHVGDQRSLPESFVQLQESQAYWSSLYAAMPRHIFEPLMLKHRSVKKLTELFELPESMVTERIESIKRERIFKQQQLSIQAQQSRYRKKSLQPGQVYDSTIQILKKLAKQVGEENLSHEVRRLLR